MLTRRDFLLRTVGVVAAARLATVPIKGRENDQRVRVCFGCQAALPEPTWLEDDKGWKYAFCAMCAQQPWPLSDCRADSQSQEWRKPDIRICMRKQWDILESNKW